MKNFIFPALAGCLLFAAAQAAAQTDAWQLNNTNGLRDKQDRFYRQQLFAQQSSYERIDPATGKDLWTYQSAIYEQNYVNCSDEGHFYTVGAGKLNALDPNTGAILYSVDSGDTDAMLYCSDDAKSIWLAGETTAGAVKQIDRATGAVAWTYASHGYAGVQGQVGNQIFLQITIEGVSTLVAIDAATGAEQWKAAMNQQQSSAVLRDSGVFLQGGGTIVKIDAATGAAAWTYSGNGSQDTLYLNFGPSNLLYVSQGTTIAQLDLATGAVLWSQALPAFNGTTVLSGFTVLKDGHVVGVTSDTAANASTVSYFDTDGTKLWEHAIAQGQISAFVDSSAHLYFRGSRNVISLDPASGAVLWNFARTTPVDGEVIFNVETYGGDVLILYGGPASRYPPMGIVRLNAATGEQYWDVWNGGSLSFVGVSDGLVLANMTMGSGIKAYKL